MSLAGSTASASKYASAEEIREWMRGKNKQIKAEGNTSLYAIICCCTIVVILLLLLCIPCGYYVYETYVICPGDPPDVPGLLRDWDGKSHQAGTVVKYRCERRNDADIVQIVTCATSEWKVVLRKFDPCIEKPEIEECDIDPPRIQGMSRIWDGSTRTLGTTVEYRCDKDPEQDRVLMMVCSEYTWKTTYQKTDDCENLLSVRRCMHSPWPTKARLYTDWDNKTREVGTQVKYMCNESPNSPVLRIMVCSRDYEWHVLADTREHCLCGHPIFYAPPIINDWDGKSLAPGAVVKYWCNTAMGKKHFMTLKCLPSANWIVTARGTCIFLVDRPLNFTDAVNYCNQLDGEVMVINNETDHEQIKQLLKEERTFDLACNHKAFIGIREIVSKQWQTEDNIYVSPYADMWTAADEGREHCVAMQQSAKYLLNNVLCNRMQYCAVCELPGNNTSGKKLLQGRMKGRSGPMDTVTPENKVCPKGSNACYVLGTQRGDYAFVAKTCEAMMGTLARTTSMKILKDVIGVVKKTQSATTVCDMLYVGLKNEKRVYETVTGTEVSYLNFGHDSARSMSRHCVVVHEYFKYMYMDEHCTLNTCFMCSVTGTPVGAIVHAGESRVPVVGAPTEDESDLEFKFREMEDKGDCMPGWESNGFRCFMFNETLVTNAEARASCRHNHGDLASLAIAFERNFITHQLVTTYSNTKHLKWHIEHFGLDNQEGNDGSETRAMDENICATLHLLPYFGWNVTDCGTLAAFVCHD